MGRTLPPSDAPDDGPRLGAWVSAHAAPDVASAELVGILDTVDLPIVVVARDCRVARFNRAATTVFGLERPDIGRPIGEIRALSDANDLAGLCAQVVADAVPFRCEVRSRERCYVLRIAPYGPGEDRSSGAVLAFTNVTAFRASLEQAIYEREYTKAILNAVIEPLVVLDADLRVQTANRAFYLAFQVTREEAQGVPLEALRNQRWDDSRLWSLLRATLAEGREFETLEIEHDLPVLGRRVLLLDACRLAREDELGSLVLLAFKDISERRRIEQELHDSARAKDEFLATLAHELRGPLAPLRNTLEIIKRADGQVDLIQQARSSMDRQLFQMTRLIDDLLDVSRISQGRLELKREPVDLALAMSQAVEACHSLLESAQHEICVALPHEPVQLDADPVRLTQIFGNLLSNACKYTEARGRIWLSAERAGRGPAAEVVIRVKDTGVGIPADQLERIFGMFAQVDRTLERSQGGLGIGLTLVKRLVEMHGGSVEALSAGVGRGSEFVVHLPVLHERRREREPGAPRVPGATHARAHRILIVDDNRDSAASLATLMELTGNETCTAHDGLEAVSAAEAFRPDVVLLDIGLPKLNGRDAARRIREQPWGARMLLVAVTGWGQDTDRRQSRDAGFDAHMVKPIDYQALMEVLGSRSGGGC